MENPVFAVEISIDASKGLNPEKPFATYVPISSGTCTIGSSPFSSIYLPFEGVSKHHSRISASGKQLVFEILKPPPDTLLNGHPVCMGQKYDMKVGDLIRIEPFDLRISIQNPEQDETITDSSSLNDSLGQNKSASELFVAEVVRSIDSESSHPHFEFRFEGEPNSLWILSEPDRQYIIGRHEDCDLVLPLSNISRKHASIRRDWDDRVFIIDLGSANGVCVNKARIRAETELHTGDVVELGGAILQFKHPDHQTPRCEETDAASGSDNGMTGSEPETQTPGSAGTGASTFCFSEMALVGGGLIFLVLATAALIWILTR